MSLRGPALAAFALAGLVPAMAAAQAAADFTARARLVPREEAVLSSDMGGRILSIAVEAGERFENGAVLVRLDCNEMVSRQRGAEAVEKGAGRVAKIRRDLGALGSVSELDVAVADAEAARARADLSLIQAQMTKCDVKAPFAGRVVERFANRAETVSAGQKLLSVLNDRSLEVELLVPSQWLRWLKEGAAFELAVDETGKLYRAQVKRIGARIDNVSQSLTVVGQLTDPPKDLLAGMSGEARFRASP